MSEARRFLRHEIGRYIQYVEIVVVEPYIVADRREIAVSVPRIGEVLLVVRRASAVSECAQIQHILRDIATSCNGQIISLEGGDDESFLLVEYVLSPQSCVGACEETVGEIDRFLSKNKKILLLHSLSLTLQSVQSSVLYICELVHRQCRSRVRIGRRLPSI